MGAGAHRRVAVATLEAKQGTCCPRLHEAVELVGKRWTGAIVAVLLEGGAMDDLSLRVISGDRSLSLILPFAATPVVLQDADRS